MTRSSDGTPRMMERCQTSLRKEPPELAVSRVRVRHGRGTVGINKFLLCAFAPHLLEGNLAIADHVKAQGIRQTQARRRLALVSSAFQNNQLSLASEGQPKSTHVLRGHAYIVHLKGILVSDGREAVSLSSPAPLLRNIFARPA